MSPDYSPVPSVHLFDSLGDHNATKELLAIHVKGEAIEKSGAPLPRPVRPEPPLDTDVHIVFCQHEYHPAYEVLLYRKFIVASRWVEPRNNFTGARFEAIGHFRGAEGQRFKARHHSK